MAKVSIIIPAFNCEAYVEDCLRSVISQSEGDIQILAIDDGSKDRTLSILEALADGDSRIEVQSFRPNSGYPGFARNQGIARATGEYIAFLDADDLYHPQKIRKIVSVFQAFPETEVVFHDVMRFAGQKDHDERTSFLATHRFSEIAAEYLQKAEDRVYLCHKDLYRFASLRIFPCHTSAITIRRDVLLSEPVWFPEGRHGEDGDLWLRLLKKHRFVFVDEVLSYYRQRPGNITSNAIHYLGGAVRVHRDNLKRGRDVFTDRELRLYNAKIAQLLADLGYAHLSRSSTKEARRAYLESLRSDFRIDALAAYIKTFVPLPIITKYRNIAHRNGY